MNKEFTLEIFSLKIWFKCLDSNFNRGTIYLNLCSVILQYCMIDVDNIYKHRVFLNGIGTMITILF